MMAMWYLAIYYLPRRCYQWDTCTYICRVYQSLLVNCCNTRNEKWTLQYYGHCNATKWQEYCNTITLQHGNIATQKYCNAEILQYNNIATQQTVQHYCNIYCNTLSEHNIATQETVQHYCNVYCNTLSEHMSLCCNKCCNWHCNTTSLQMVQQYITVTTTFHCNKSTAMALNTTTMIMGYIPLCLLHGILIEYSACGAWRQECWLCHKNAQRAGGKRPEDQQTPPCEVGVAQ